MAQGALQRFVARRELRALKSIQAALNSVAYSLGQAVVNKDGVLYHFSSVSDDGPILHVWVITRTPMYNPKVQCYVLRRPSAVRESELVEGAVALDSPAQLNMQL